jgi:CBS domain-containing protein
VTAETLVRDAMVPAPAALDCDDTAQEAARRLLAPEVRAVLVCSDGRLAGVVTRKTLVREVVAAGRDPRSTSLREIAEPPNVTVDSLTRIDDAFRLLEEQDLERVPVTEGGRLVGILSRAVLQRRLAEDESPADEPATG